MVSRASKCSTSTMALSCSLAKTWVKNNYERHEEGVVAKSVMYKHYEDHCRDEGRNNMETSIFGRVVKNVFPDVTIRRLGGRDNLKYYYCGIRAKESSPYAIDNTTTTRPKRRLRKRALVTDKEEVHNCLRWLHSHYEASNESSVVKTVVYDGYVLDAKNRCVEALSIQYFGMVVTHAFPNVTKRKLGPRTSQQKYYFGMQERIDPMPPELVPGEYLNIDDAVLKNRKTYRENHLEEDEEEDFCRSPVSDGMPDMAPQILHSVAFDGEMAASPHLSTYPYDHYLKEDPEPVDYSFSSLRLKDEAVQEDEESILVKDEPLDLHIGARDSCERRTPERPPSIATTYGSASPSPPVKEKTKKLYKPRFHFDYHDDSSWNVDQDGKIDSSEPNYFGDTLHSQSDMMLKNWLLKNVEPCKNVHVNRDQLYEYYKKSCDLIKYRFLPLTYFDETILKSFSFVGTGIHPSRRKTFYDGIRVRHDSPLFQKIEELYNIEEADSTWADEESTEHSMEMSPCDVSVTFPLQLEEEDEEEIEETFCEGSLHSTPVEDDMHSASEVLRDGKFYLRKWLIDNFDPVQDSCVLKADAYRHYEAYARSISQTPFEMNVFGKIVRQVFPDVSIRRLGGRIKPQYHYCGIAVKPSSPLFQYMSGKDPAQRSRKKEIATDNRSAEIVIDWLKKSYEFGKDKVILKSEVFNNYSQYCSTIGEFPVTLNYFGKLVKHCFPNVEVRKFGGRSEPTWYYYGLVSRLNNLPFHGGISVFGSEESKEGIQNIMTTSTSDIIACSSSMSQATPMEVGVSMPRHATSPIPISLPGRSPAHLHLGTPTGHSFGSPSTLLQGAHGMQPSLRHSPYVHNSPRENFDPHHRIGSPLEGGAHFFREGSLAQHPIAEGERRSLQADAIFSSSIEGGHTKGGILLVPSGTGEGLYSRDHHSLFPHHKFPAHLGGQIVPSQTPPSICSVQVTDQAMIVNKRNRRPFSQHEEYEMLNDIGME